MENNEEMTFEVALEKVEKIITELESGNIELDKAIEKYTEAMKTIKFCNDKLNNATEKVNKILNENGTLTDFKIEE